MKKILLFIFSVFFLFSCGEKSVETESGESLETYQCVSGALESYEFSEGSLFLNYKYMKIKAEFVNGGVLHFLTADINADFDSSPSYSVVESLVDDGAELIEKDGLVGISFGNIEAFFFSNEAGISVYQLNELVKDFDFFLKRTKQEIVSNYIYADFEDEHIFGLGERNGHYLRNGHWYELWNFGHFDATSGPFYDSFSSFLAMQQEHSYAVFLDEPSPSSFSFDTNSILAFGTGSGELNFYFFCLEEENPAQDFLSSYAVLTGNAALPPLWAFGYHQSKFSYMDEEEVMTVAENFEENDLPLDAIYLDIDYMDEYQPFTVDEEAFPDLSSMTADLLNRGIRTVAIIDPQIGMNRRNPVYRSGLKQDVFIMQGSKPYVGECWAGETVFPDFTFSNTQAWWTESHEILMEGGIAGLWNDMNEPSDFAFDGSFLSCTQNNNGYPVEHWEIFNVYANTMAEATYNALLSYHPNDRPFVLSRSATSGMQRYAFTWTGDSGCKFEHMEMGIHAALNLGLSGMPFTGSDVGGFLYSPDEEVLTRWFQVGVFMPFMRGHNTKQKFQKEPYEFPDSLSVLQKYLKLRYEILPEIYTAAYLASSTAKPMMRPLWMDFGFEYIESSPLCYLFGESFLVCAVAEKELESIAITLPSGRWYDFWTDEIYESGSYDWPVVYDDIPVFVAAGSILFTYAQDLSSTMDLSENRDVTLSIFPDEDGKAEGILYEDDGISFEYQSGNYRLTSFSYVQSGSSAEMVIEKEGDFDPKRSLIIELPETIQSLTVNGKAILVEDHLASAEG